MKRLQDIGKRKDKSGKLGQFEKGRSEEFSL